MMDFDYIKNNWFKLHDSLRYFIIGSINSGISYVIFVLAIMLLGKGHYQISVALQWSLTSFIAYLNQKFFVFCTRGNYIKEYLKCCSTWFMSYILNAFLIELFVKHLNINVYIGQAAAMLIAAVFTYTLFKIYAFRGGVNVD